MFLYYYILFNLDFMDLLVSKWAVYLFALGLFGMGLGFDRSRFVLRTLRLHRKILLGLLTNCFQGCMSILSCV